MKTKSSDMRRFAMYRESATEQHSAQHLNAPDEVQFEGVVFSDGKCAIRWLTGAGSVAVWDSFGDMMIIHGHPEYGSKLVWLDEPLIET